MDKKLPIFAQQGILQSKCIDGMREKIKELTPPKKVTLFEKIKNILGKK
jgi:hypothetical protein